VGFSGKIFPATADLVEFSVISVRKPCDPSSVVVMRFAVAGVARSPIEVFAVPIWMAVDVIPVTVRTPQYAASISIPIGSFPATFAIEVSMYAVTPSIQAFGQSYFASCTFPFRLPIEPIINYFAAAM
jgi:hypothetical protein